MLLFHPPPSRWMVRSLVPAIAMAALPLLATPTGPRFRTRHGEILGDPGDDELRRAMRQARLNRSAALGAILELLSQNPDRDFRAIDFTHEANLAPGSVHPLLDKLERAKLIEMRRHGKPAPASSKTYRLTDLGARFALRYQAATRAIMR